MASDERSGIEYCKNDKHTALTAIRRSRGGFEMRCAMCNRMKRLKNGAQYDVYFPRSSELSLEDQLTASAEELAAELDELKGTNAPHVRPSFSELWLEVAASVAKRGTCPRLRVGAVLVDAENQIISTGYNGAIRGAAHCDDAGCDLEPETGRCKRTVHAELNALLQAGKAANGATLYVTHSPCLECATMAIQAGVARIVFREQYGSGERMFARLLEAGFTRLHGSPHVCEWEKGSTYTWTLQTVSAARDALIPTN